MLGPHPHGHLSYHSPLLCSSVGFSSVSRTWQAGEASRIIYQQFPLLGTGTPFYIHQLILIIQVPPERLSFSILSKPASALLFLRHLHGLSHSPKLSSLDNLLPQLREWAPWRQEIVIPIMCSVTGLWHTEGLQKHLLIVVPLNHNILVSKEADRVSETARSFGKLGLTTMECTGRIILRGHCVRCIKKEVTMRNSETNKWHKFKYQD